MSEILIFMIGLLSFLFISGLIALMIYLSIKEIGFSNICFNILIFIFEGFILIGVFFGIPFACLFAIGFISNFVK